MEICLLLHYDEECSQTVSVISTIFLSRLLVLVCFPSFTLPSVSLMITLGSIFVKQNLPAFYLNDSIILFVFFIKFMAIRKR
jgi:hypothetical protein